MQDERHFTMNTYPTYDTLRAYKVNHKLILGLAESLNDEQLNWRLSF